MAEKETYLEKRARRKAARAKKLGAEKAVKATTPSVEPPKPKVNVSPELSYNEKRQLRQQERTKAKVSSAAAVIKNAEENLTEHNREWDSAKLESDLSKGEVGMSTKRKRGFPSDLGSGNVNKGTSMWPNVARAAAWAFRPLSALQSAAIAPIAAQDYKYGPMDPRNLVHAFEVSGKTFFKEIGVNDGSPRENLERGALNYVFGDERMANLPPLARNTAEAFVGVFSDPAAIIFVPAFRKVALKSLATAAAEGRAPSIFRDTVKEMYTFEGTPRREGASKVDVDIDNLALKADEGDELAAKALAEKMKSNLQDTVAKQKDKITGDKKPKADIPTDLNVKFGSREPDFISKKGKGNKYWKQDGEWYSADGKKVTNHFVKKAAEKGLAKGKLLDKTKGVKEESAIPTELDGTRDAMDRANKELKNIPDSKGKEKTPEELATVDRANKALKKMASDEAAEKAADDKALNEIDKILGTTKKEKPSTLKDKADAAKAKADDVPATEAKIIEGFIDNETGKFLTREEAAEAINLKGAHVASEDMKLLGNQGKFTAAIKDKKGSLWTGANHGTAYENMVENAKKNTDTGKRDWTHGITKVPIHLEDGVKLKPTVVRPKPLAKKPKKPVVAKPTQHQPKVKIKMKKIGIEIPKPKTATKAKPWSKVGAPAVIDRKTGEVLAAPPSMAFDFRPSRTEGVENNVAAFRRLRKEMNVETPLEDIGMGFISKDGQEFIPDKVQLTKLDAEKAVEKSVLKRAKNIQNEMKRQAKKRFAKMQLNKSLAPIKAVHRLVHKKNKGRGQVGASKWWKANPDLRKGLTFEDIKRASQEAVWEHIRRTPLKKLKQYHAGNEKVVRELEVMMHNTAVWAAKNAALELKGQALGISRYKVQKALKEGTLKNVQKFDEGKVPDLRDNIQDPEIRRLSRMGMDPEDIMEGQEALAAVKAENVRPRVDERLQKEVKVTMPKKGKAVVFGRKEMSKRARKAKRKRLFAREVKMLKEKKISKLSADEYAKIKKIEAEIEDIKAQTALEDAVEFASGLNVKPTTRMADNKTLELRKTRDINDISTKDPILTTAQRRNIKFSEYDKKVLKAAAKREKAAKKAAGPVEMLEIAKKNEKQTQALIERVKKKVNVKRDKLVKQYKKKEAAANKSIKNNEPKTTQQKKIRATINARNKIEEIDTFLKDERRLRVAAAEMRQAKELADAAKQVKSSGQATLYSGIPLPAAKKMLFDPLFSAYTRGIDRLGGRIAGALRKEILNPKHLNASVAAKLNRWSSLWIEEFGLEKTFKVLKEEFELKKHRWEVHASDLAMAIRNIDDSFAEAAKPITKSSSAYKFKNPSKGGDISKEAWQLRAKQVAGGSLTTFDKKFKAVQDSAKEFQKLEKMLRDRGLLGDHQFHRLTNMEIKKLIGFKRKGDKHYNTGSIRAMKEQYDKIARDLADLELNQRDHPRYAIRHKNLVESATVIDQARMNATARLQIHYKNAGKTYFKLIHNKLNLQTQAIRRFGGMTKKWNIQRDNWQIDLKDGTADVVVSAKGNPLRSKNMASLDKMVHKGISDQSRDVFLFDLFKKVASNPDWVKKKVGKNVKGWRKMPVSEDAWGPLSGKFVPEPVHANLVSSYRELNEFETSIRKWTTRWKAGKTLWSARTQARNLMSNVVLADVIADMPVTSSLSKYVAGMKAVHQVKKTGKVKNSIEKAYKYDTLLSKSTYTANELRGAQMMITDEMIAGLSSKGSMMQVVKSVGEWAQRNKVKPAYAYTVIEEGMKYGIFKKKVEDALKVQGVKDLDELDAITRKNIVRDSEMIANKALFDYSKVPPAIKAIRAYYSPFITFSYKALPGLAKGFLRKPWKAVKYLGGLLAVQKMFDKMSGASDEDIERERRALPHYMQRNMMPFQPSHMRIPVDDKGTVKYFDLSFIMPWGAATEMAGDIGFLPQVFAPSNPVFTTVYDILGNENNFLQKPLTFQHDTKWEVAKKLTLHALQAAQPGITDAIFKTANKLYFRPKKGIGGKEQNSYLQVLLDTVVGLKFRDADYVTNLMNSNRKITAKKREIATDFFQQMSDVMFKRRLSPDQAAQKQNEILRNVNDDLQKLKDETLYLYNIQQEKKQ